MSQLWSWFMWAWTSCSLIPTKWKWCHDPTIRVNNTVRWQLTNYKSIQVHASPHGRGAGQGPSVSLASPQIWPCWWAPSSFAPLHAIIGWNIHSWPVSSWTTVVDGTLDHQLVYKFLIDAATCCLAYSTGRLQMRWWWYFLVYTSLFIRSWLERWNQIP